MNTPSQMCIEPLESRIAPASFTITPATIEEGDSGTKQLTFTVIADEDPVVVLSSPTLTEGNLGNLAKDMNFNVAIDRFPANSIVELLYHTSDGTAVSTGTVTAGTLDYVATSGVGFITVATDANGHAAGTITVKVNGDGVTENNEFFNVVMDGASIQGGASIPMSSVTTKGTIIDNDTTVLTIGDATIVEGDSGQKNAVFLVTLTPTSQGSVTVNYFTNSGTATAGQDFPSKSGTLTFAPGTTAQTIVVPIFGDLTYEGDENFTVRLSNPSFGISIANDVGTGIIQDNDAVPTVSVLPASALEGNTGEIAQLSFVAKLSGKSSTPVTLTYTTQDGTATAGGSDYTATAGSITFFPGETEKAILINVTGDETNEGNETMSIALSDPIGANLSPTASMATGTILNDDIFATVNSAVFNEGAGIVTMMVTLTEAPVPGSTATVNFVLFGGFGGVNSDVKLHDPAATSVVFNAGETQKTITLDIIDDTIDENNETFFVQLTGASGASIVPFINTGTVTIQDNDLAPTMRILDAQITEGDSGTKDMTFKVTLSTPSGQAVTVHAATLIDPTGGADFSDFEIFADQLITFAAGETEKMVTVKILGDTIDERAEAFKVLLNNAPNATIVDAEAVGTIVDNDLRAVSISDASAGDTTGTMMFTVSIPVWATQEITVDFTTIDGTAKAGTHYLTTSGTLTFPPGITTQTIEVPVFGNNTVGPDKTFSVVLMHPVNATISDDKANGRISDDESFYRLEALSVFSIDEDDSSSTSKTVSFRITRGGDRTLPGSVNYKTVDGTAHAGTGAGGDYLEKIGTVNFAAGESEKTVKVTVRKDFAHELDENFQFMLTGSMGGVLKDGSNVVTTLSGTTTILDNDAAPTISIASVSAPEGTPTSPFDPGTTDFTFTVSLSAADEVNDVTVMYETIDGTGVTGAISSADLTRPQDFNRIFPILLTIPRGSLSATFVVHALRDTISEGDETFTVKLSDPMGDGETFAPGGDIATGTIKNDDGAPTITFQSSSLTIIEGNAGEAPATFTVKLSKASEQPVTVNVGLPIPPWELVYVGPGPIVVLATLGSDFIDIGVPATLTFAPGETTKTITYSVLGDVRHEADETFTVLLSNAQNGSFGSGSSTQQATATIKNDDPTPVLVVQNVTIVEGNNGETTNLVFNVTLAGESDQNVTVDYTTLDIGAFSTGAAPDYQTVSGTLTFAPGEHTKTISVPVFGDDLKEGDEAFSLRLSNPTNALILDGQALAIGTILEDGDTTIAVTVSDVKTIEGDSGFRIATFTVALSAASDVPVTVEVATRNGTAVAGADYTAHTTTLTFAAGEKTKTFNVALRTDTVFEATESFFVEVKNPTGGAVIRDGEGRATIYNDDIQIVNAQTVRYVDADGDLATVHISKGKLTIDGLNPVLNFSAVNEIGGRILQLIDFTNHRATFNHTNLSVTADLQPGFSASEGVSDGRVDVGYIQGGVILGQLLQILDSIDFGTVTIEGDLGKIVAGDQSTTGRAVANLNVLSHGAWGTDTGAPDNVSDFVGGAGRIKVNGDCNGVLVSLGNASGDIESLTISGVLRGDSQAGSGQIFVTGTLVNATIGGIVGGSGDVSGTITGNFTHDATLSRGASIGKIHVLGDILGGSGDNSGRIFAPNIGAVIVDGNLKGGSGSSSGLVQDGIPSSAGSLGSVVIKGDAIGGTGANSGEIFAAKTLGTVLVRGSLLGGAGTDSGSIFSGGGANTVKVLQNIVGAAGERSGSVQIAKSLTNFQLGTAATGTDGNLKGGKGASSGLLSIGRDLNTAGIIYGSIEGGSGWSSGGVTANGMLTNFTIDGDIVGGSTNLTDVTTINASGFVAAQRIGALAIFGDIKSGTKADSSHTVVASGTIRAFGDIRSLVVNNLIGNSEVPVVIAAGGAAAAAKNQTLGALTVKGNSAFANILGGYGGGVSEFNPLGTPLNPDAKMGTVRLLGSVEATNIVAGIDAGEDGRFGTEDDAVISGGLADNSLVKSRIAAVIIQGLVKPNTDRFGVVAQIIGAATIGNTPLQLKPAGLDNIELGIGNTNFLLHEVGLS